MSLDIAVAAVAIAPFVAALAAPSMVRAFGAISGWILALVPALSFVFLSSLISPVADGEIIAARLGWAPAHGLVLSFLIVLRNKRSRSLRRICDNFYFSHRFEGKWF